MGVNQRRSGGRCGELGWRGSRRATRRGCGAVRRRGRAERQGRARGGDGAEGAGRRGAARLALGPAPAGEAAALPGEPAQEAPRRRGDGHGAGAPDALRGGGRAREGVRGVSAGRRRGSGGCRGGAAAHETERGEARAARRPEARAFAVVLMRRRSSRTIATGPPLRAIACVRERGKGL